MLQTVKMSLRDLLGAAYIDAVVDSAAFLGVAGREDLTAVADEQVDFYPREFAERLDALLPSVGTRVAAGVAGAPAGAPSASFAKAANAKAAPLACLGPYRAGEDGRLYFSAKSEHYHAPLGHRFPGYRLIDNARKLGISNAAHNNYRGSITRRLELELIKQANGADDAALAALLDSDEPGALNRVINLETGSLAVEAGIKMMLARFWRLEASFPQPKYGGRLPVFLVVADNQGGRQANYHGTTVTAQTMRGLWPDLYAALSRAGAYRVEAVRINDLADFKAKLGEFEKPPYKVAGFLHEIVLMNYSAILLGRDYLRQAHDLCRAADVPVLVDEIQSCMWYEGMFLYRLYGLKPDFVSVGKGFPGGEYTASKILFGKEHDNLSQFGALVTNGQEELASLAYLVTMEFARANGAHLREIGEAYQRRLEDLCRAFPGIVREAEGLGLLSGLVFHRVEGAVEFARRLNADCIDVSAQTYKADCPPTALTKLPVICGERAVEFVVDKMRGALAGMAEMSPR